mmetsp:Transcript_111898/g.222412  ORF Transcript_111898/g.222412 Transcript_111898/m.222412 type:complete len:149 (-) Transcript_111898:1389-1835(-)
MVGRHCCSSASAQIWMLYTTLTLPHLIRQRLYRGGIATLLNYCWSFLRPTKCVELNRWHGHLQSQMQPLALLSRRCSTARSSAPAPLVGDTHPLPSEKFESVLVRLRQPTSEKLEAILVRPRVPSFPPPSDSSLGPLAVEHLLSAPER